MDKHDCYQQIGYRRSLNGIEYKLVNTILQPLTNTVTLQNDCRIHEFFQCRNRYLMFWQWVPSNKTSCEDGSPTIVAFS